MIQITDLQLKKEMKDGVAAPSDITKYLLKNYSSWEIAEALGEILATNAIAPTRITISAEDFLAHFKVRGVKLDGTKEGRGNKMDVGKINDVVDMYKKIQDSIK